MGLRGILAALAMAVALGPGVAAAASPQEVVDVFRRGCLDHLPDFTGSEGAFQKLGFTGSGDLFRPDLPGPGMRAFASRSIDENGYVHGYCSLAVEVPPEASIIPVLTATIAELTNNGFRHEGFKGVKVRTGRFVWREGAANISVVLLQKVDGTAALIAMVNVAPE